jgi:polyferredoxin
MHIFYKEDEHQLQLEGCGMPPAIPVWIKVLVLIIFVAIFGYLSYLMLFSPISPLINDLFQTDPFSYWIGFGITVSFGFIIGFIIKIIKNLLKGQPPMA